MKLEELRRQFRKRTQEELCTELEGFIARKRTKILERCDCGHLAEEHAGPDERDSLRGTKPALPIGYCYHCSCTRHKPMPDATEELPVPLDMDKARAGAAEEIEWSKDFETLPLPTGMEGALPKTDAERSFAKDVMGEFRDFRLEPIPFPTLVDATRGDTAGAAKKLLGTHAFWIPAGREHEASECDLVQLKGFFHGTEVGDLNFSVWDGKRDPSGNPITVDVQAKHLYILEHEACPHERGDRSGAHSTFRRGLNCRMCGNLGRVVSSKSARLLPRSKTP